MLKPGTPHGSERQQFVWAPELSNSPYLCIFKVLSYTSACDKSSHCDCYSGSAYTQKFLRIGL